MPARESYPGSPVPARALRGQGRAPEDRTRNVPHSGLPRAVRLRRARVAPEAERGTFRTLRIPPMAAPADHGGTREDERNGGWPERAGAVLVEAWAG